MQEFYQIVYKLYRDILQQFWETSCTFKEDMHYIHQIQSNSECQKRIREIFLSDSTRSDNWWLRVDHSEEEDNNYHQFSFF